MFQAGGEIDADIEEATYSRDLGGRRQPGVNTVGQQEILSSRSDRKFDAPAMGIDATVTELCSNVLRLVKVLDVDVTIRGETIGPKDMNEDYAVEVTYQRDDPVMQIQQRVQGREDVKLGILDPETALTDAGRENAQEILRKALVYRMASSEQILSAVIELAAAEFKRRNPPQQGEPATLGLNGQSQGVTGPAPVPLFEQPWPIEGAAQPAQTGFGEQGGDIVPFDEQLPVT
mgnify:FL=1